MSLQMFGKYQLMKKLATGGMAEVWLARQTGIEGFNRNVVVKRILPHLAEDPDFIQMFLNEARIASRFSHPNIAQIFDLGEENGTYFIAMEFVQGEDLGRIIRKWRSLETDHWIDLHISLRVVADACQGLYYAHTRTDDAGRPLKVVHRDVSPQNILVSFDGTTKLVDFGIAKAADQASSTKSGALKGKFTYMAPEQASGKALDARTDVFSLGLVLYELLTGTRPFKRESEVATLQAVLDCRIEPPSRVADVPDHLDDVVMPALAKSPSHRYQDAREFQRAIETFLVENRYLATSVEVAEFMHQLFGDRQAEDGRIKTPSPASESVSRGGAKSRSGIRNVRASLPDQTLDDGEVESVKDNDPLPAEIESRAGAARRKLSIQLEANPVAAATHLDEDPDSTRFDERSLVQRASNFDADEPENRSQGKGTRRISKSTRRKSEREIAASSPADRSTVANDRLRARPSTIIPAATARKASVDNAFELSNSELKGDHLDSQMGLSKFVDVEKEKKAQANALKMVIAAVLLVGVFLAAYFLKDVSFGSRDASPSSVSLTVTTNPPTRVTLVPSAPNQKSIELGSTPLHEKRAGQIGDTLLLVNEARAIKYEVAIGSVDADGRFRFDKIFREITLKITTRPKLRGGSIWRGDARVGSIDLAMSIYPGTYSFLLKSDQLDSPFPFVVKIDDSRRVVEHEVDVGQFVRSPP